MEGTPAMAKHGKRLGRGLNALVSDYRADEEEGQNERVPDGGTAAQEAVVPPRGTAVVKESVGGQGGMVGGAMAHTGGVGVGVEARMVGVGELRVNPYQPRRNIDPESVRELAKSIESAGIIQPIVVREVEGGGGLEIVAGERRLVAARLAGLEEVPVLVREASDEQMLEWALVENIHREDLNAVDRALAYRQYCEAFDLTVEEVGKRLGEDRTTVANYVRLLELPGAVQRLLAEARISMGHARALLGVSEDGRKVELASLVASKGVSVRELERIVRGERSRGGGVGERRPRSGGAPEAHVRELERRFEEALETKVKIHLGRVKGSGRIMIEFYNVDDFERIAKTVGVETGD